MAKLSSLLVLLLVAIYSAAHATCQQPAGFELDYTGVNSVSMGPGPVNDTFYTYKYYQETLNDSIDFTTGRPTYQPGEQIYATIVNNSHTTYLLCDTNPKLVYDEARNMYLTRYEADHFTVVQTSPVQVMGYMFNFDRSYSVLIEPVYPGGGGFEKNKESYLLAPGEKIEIRIRLPSTEGHYQLKLYVLQPGQPLLWQGRGMYAHSKPFIVEK